MRIFANLADSSWANSGVNQGTHAGDCSTIANIPLGSGSAFLLLMAAVNP